MSRISMLRTWLQLLPIKSNAMLVHTRQQAGKKSKNNFIKQNNINTTTTTTTMPTDITYTETRRDNTVDTYHNKHQIADPYRYCLELYKSLFLFHSLTFLVLMTVIDTFIVFWKIQNPKRLRNGLQNRMKYSIIISRMFPIRSLSQRL